MISLWRKIAKAKIVKTHSWKVVSVLTTHIELVLRQINVHQTAVRKVTSFTVCVHR